MPHYKLFYLIPKRTHIPAWTATIENNLSPAVPDPVAEEFRSTSKLQKSSAEQISFFMEQYSSSVQV